MTAHEIQQDAIYAEAYKQAEKTFNKKYEKLKFLAKDFMQIYESCSGEPDESMEENANYFKLKKLLGMS